MATNFTEVYDLFLSQIDDNELGQVDADEFDYVMERYLINCLPDLEESMFDLNSIDMESKNFGIDLTIFEKSIISKSMKLEWLRQRMNSAELMVKSIGDRDFNSVQGFNYLREISSLERDLKKDVRDYVLKNSYREDYLDWLTS